MVIKTVSMGLLSVALSFSLQALAAEKDSGSEQSLAAEKKQRYQVDPANWRIELVNPEVGALSEDAAAFFEALRQNGRVVSF